MDEQSSYGYLHITLTVSDGQPLLRSNGERAYFVSLLQDSLSPLLLLRDIPAHRQLASCIDLLAFSITRQSVHLIVFTIDMTVATRFTAHLVSKLTQYQDEAFRLFSQRPGVLRKQIDQLTGQHQALAHSAAIHLLHSDWEYDRYSSIGFYLHDRRGDWMRIWRLSRIYDNNPIAYRELLIHYTAEAATSGFTFPAYPVSLRHG